MCITSIWSQAPGFVLHLRMHLHLYVHAEAAAPRVNSGCRVDDFTVHVAVDIAPSGNACSPFGAAPHELTMSVLPQQRIMPFIADKGCAQAATLGEESHQWRLLEIRQCRGGVTLT